MFLGKLLTCFIPFTGREVLPDVCPQFLFLEWKQTPFHGVLWLIGSGTRAGDQAAPSLKERTGGGEGAWVADRLRLASSTHQPVAITLRALVSLLICKTDSMFNLKMATRTQ